jgi:XTP/dITP diphosphohydrolase
VIIKEVLIATGNIGKVREISEIFTGFGISFTSLKDHWAQVPDIPETGSTFFQNAKMKAEWVFSRKGIWTLADDSGLEVDALNGEPGVMSARYAGSAIKSDEANNRKLLDKLAGVELAKRTARFKCVVVLLGAGVEYSASGVCEGKICFNARGSGGFGYDPLFIPLGFDKTFAELDSTAKHAISHRGMALQALKEKIK